MLPKFPAPSAPGNNWSRSLISLIAYIAIGLFIFPNYKVLLILALIVLLHETGHLLAMRKFRYKDTGIFFIPFVGGFASGTKREISQKESVVILLCGPLPGILIGALLILLANHQPDSMIAGISLKWIGNLFLLLNALNLLPVYPLDGGQLLNRVFLDEEGFSSQIFVLLSALLLAGLSFYLKFYPLLLFPLMMLWKLRPDLVAKKIEQEIEAEGILTNLDYEDLPDADYWKLRSILIRTHPSCREFSLSQESYDEKEEKMQRMIASLLHRMLVQDISKFGKVLTCIVWIATLLLAVQFSLFIF